MRPILTVHGGWCKVKSAACQGIWWGLQLAADTGRCHVYSFEVEAWKDAKEALRTCLDLRSRVQLEFKP